MLARLQQFTTLGPLALVALAAVLTWRAGLSLWAVAGALAIVLGYAAVLAVEFALLRRAHGLDPAPRASSTQLMRAWWGEVGSAPRVFCWRQPFRSQRWPDRIGAGHAGQRGLLLVHGFFCNRGVWNAWLERLHAGGFPCIAVNLEPVFGSIDAYAAGIEAAVQSLERATGLAPVVVAHSMGGLALRHWWSLPGNDDRIHHAVTLGTPHAGTWLARFSLTANGHQMQQDSAWLRALAAREQENRHSRFTCFYSHCDNIVFPPSTATLPGADNRHLPGVAHVQMVDQPEPWGQALHWLR